MKKDINITIKGHINEEVLENYYRQLWSILKEQYGEDVLIELLKIYENNERDKQ